MPRVIQIRDVPDEVHDALSDAARARGQSLTRFMLEELEVIARRAAVARHNSEVISRTRERVATRLGRETIAAAVRAGRDE